MTEEGYFQLGTIVCAVSVGVKDISIVTAAKCCKNEVIFLNEILVYTLFKDFLFKLTNCS